MASGASSSLGAWCADAVNGLRALPALRAVDAHHEATIEFGAVRFADGAARVELGGWLTDLATQAAEAITSSLYLGALPNGAEALAAPRHEGASEYARHVVERFHALCVRSVAWWAERQPAALVAESLAPKLLPVDLLHAFALHGPPPPIPVPALTASDFDRLAGRFRKGTSKHDAVERDDRKLVASYEIDGYRILLIANLHAHPHGIEIFVRDAAGGMIEALSVDTANASARWSPDGDQLATRRFVTWLRELILRGDADERLRFDDEVNDEQHQASVSELLLYEEPYFGDEFVIDWRCQLDLLVPKHAHTNLVPAEAQAWRTFLGRVVHPALG